MAKPKMSIIVPVYNVEKYLKECLNSIINQSLREIEVICVNDGSTDHSLEILNEYAKSDTRIRVISKVNDGLGAARNTGINHAYGEYLGFVDSDDFIDLNMFEELYNRAIEVDADVVIGNLELYFTDTGETKLYRDYDCYQKLDDKKFFTAYDETWIVQNIGVWDRIYKKQFIDQYHLRNPEHVIFEDALFSFQTSVLAQRISVINRPFYKYRKNTGTAITDNEIQNDNYKYDFLSNCRDIKFFLQKQGNYDRFSCDFLIYQFINASWHQSNATTYYAFKRFFREMQAMTIVDEYNFVETLPYPMPVFYAKMLRQNKLLICYLVFKSKRFVRIEKECIYIRIPKTKKEFGIMHLGGLKK